MIVGVDGRDGGLDATVLAHRLALVDVAAITIAWPYPTIGVQDAKLIWRDIALESDAHRILDDAESRPGGETPGSSPPARSTPGAALR